MLQPLDGPSKHGKLLSITTVTPVEVKVGAAPYSERKVITMQSSKLDTPDYGDFYVYFAEDDSTPSAATVSTNGFLHGKNAKESYEAGEKQRVWVMSVSITIHIRVAERS